METVLELLRRALADDATAEQRVEARALLDQLAPLVGRTQSDAAASPAAQAITQQPDDPIGQVLDALTARIRAATAGRPTEAIAAKTAPRFAARRRPIPFVPARRRRLP